MKFQVGFVDGNLKWSGKSPQIPHNKYSLLLCNTVTVKLSLLKRLTNRDEMVSVNDFTNCQLYLRWPLMLKVYLRFILFYITHNPADGEVYSI
jgi:hypothetical protein